jgi:5-aminolevulinate synthase
MAHLEQLLRIDGAKARSPRPLTVSAAMLPAQPPDRRGRSYAQGFIFTTALPSSVSAAATAAIRHPKSLELGTRMPSGACGAHQGGADRRAADDDEPDTYRARLRRRPGTLQRSERSFAHRARHLHPADQLPDGAEGKERLRITPSPYHHVLITMTA